MIYALCPDAEVRVITTCRVTDAFYTLQMASLWMVHPFITVVSVTCEALMMLSVNRKHNATPKHPRRRHAQGNLEVRVAQTTGRMNVLRFATGRQSNHPTSPSVRGPPLASLYFLRLSYQFGYQSIVCFGILL